MYGFVEHTKESVRQKLGSDQKWIEGAIKLLYSFQTDEEVETGVTVEQNGQGFNYNDGLSLTLYAQQLLKGKTLDDYQLEVAKEKLPKYWRQILLYIQENGDEIFN